MTCPTCKHPEREDCTGGWIVNDDPDAAPLACPRLVAHLRLRRYEFEWPLPAKLRCATLGYFPPDSGGVFSAELEAAHETARQFVERLGEPDSAVNVFLGGAVGTGKSFLAAAAVLAARDRSICALFVSASELAARLRNAVKPESEESVEQIVDTLTSAGLLALDDLGEERLTDFVEENFYLILKRRLENERPLIITTNLTGQKLLVRIGDGMYRLLDRMRDGGMILRLEGKSLRGRAA